MRALVIGAGGVGSAIANIASRKPFITELVLADYDHARATAVTSKIQDPRFSAMGVDAGDLVALEGLIRKVNPDVVVNAVDPRFVMNIFNAAKNAGVNYMDMAMSLSTAHPTDPFNKVGVMLGDEQFAQANEWEKAGKYALVGMGIEPGMSDVFARYAQDYLFSEIDAVTILDGSNLSVDGYEFAPSFSIWTVIEECLNPPLLWEKDKGWFTTPPFSEPEVFEFPGGIGAVECVNVEHEEVNMLPRSLKAKRVAFKYGLGTEFINVLQTLHALGLDSVNPVSVRSKDGRVSVAPRDVVAAVLPDPASLADRMTGKTCAGTLVTGTGLDGKPRAVYLSHVCDTEWTNANYGSQAVVWQTALVPVISLELLATGVWSGTGVKGPEEFDAKPFLDLLAGEYGQPWGLDDRDPANPGKL
mgnify:CR=1 FL=1